MSRRVRIRTRRVRIRLGTPLARKEVVLTPQKKNPLQTQIEEGIAVLAGKMLWRCHRAADRVAFSFGERWTVADRSGKMREVGEFALHVQCAWRLAQKDRILAGSAVARRPVILQDEGRSGDFDWDAGARPQDDLLPALLNRGQREFAVETVAVGDGGSLHFSFSEDWWLVIEPDRSCSGEHWRFFGYNTGPHLVMTGKGMESSSGNQ